MNTSITSYGYKILKKELSTEQITKIKKDMMIIPFVYDPVKGGQNKDKKFNILCESPKAGARRKGATPSVGSNRHIFSVSWR